MSGVPRNVGAPVFADATRALSTSGGAGSREADQWVEAAREAAQHDRHVEAGGSPHNVSRLSMLTGRWNTRVFPHGPLYWTESLLLGLTRNSASISFAPNT